jgi:glycosyltransferase involved in cell wall biosynthesis
VVSYLDGITSDSIALETQGVKIHGHRPEDYSHAMLQFFENPGLAQQMGQAARERAVSVFGLDRIVQQWAELFEKLAG